MVAPKEGGGQQRAPVMANFDKSGAIESLEYDVVGLAPNLRDMAPRHSSESVEHFTPPAVVEAARKLMGAIDLDPASSQLAQVHIVRAERWLTEKDNGFLRPWKGRVFLNPPGGRCDKDGRALHAVQGAKGYCYSDGSVCNLPAQSSGRMWWHKLVREWQAGAVSEAVFVAFSLELLQVTQSLPAGESAAAFPLCIPWTRLKYWKPDGKGGIVESTSPPHASALIYLPLLEKRGGSRGLYNDERLSRFEEIFSEFGQVRL